MIRRAALLLVLAALAASPVAAQKATPARRTPLAPDTRMLKDLPLRSIGPANMGGRVSDLAVVEKTPTTFYVALGTGGVMKTVNLGTTWSAVFEKQAVASVGAVAVWQKNPQIVWVGTGEANSRNSSSWGNGVYVSKDGGGEWKHLGLEATHNIARVVTDPGDSNIVYVAALGRLWGENAERGVYKTVDGGKSWQQVLKVDARTGACDLVMDPAHPQVLYAAMYARKRTPWSYSGVGVTGGIFRTRDGGRTWKKLAGGLPARTGRIGLDLCRSKPNVVVAVVESDEGGQLDDTEDLSRAGGVFRSDDGGDNWKRTSPWSPRPFYFSQIRVQPNDDQRVYLLGYEMWISDDGGRSFRREGAKNLHPDLHAMWIHPENGDHVVLGTDGGVYLSHDRTRNWRFLDNLAAGEFYTVTVDDRDPYRVYGGLQDNQSWGGPSSTRFEVQQWIGESGSRGILNDQWFTLGGGDGFYVAVDPRDPDIVYYESQGGSISRVNLRSGKERWARPAAREGEARYRFNWNAPFMISPHDPDVLWLGGNHLFRLYQRGDRWEKVSPDLTTRDAARMDATGSAAETFCTIVTLDESPVKAGVIWVGTDDGKLWVTKDAGKTWSDLTRNLKGVPAGLYVSRVEASHHDPDVAYVAIDGHRTNDFGVYALVTRDGGRSFTSIAAGLPKNQPVKVIREGLRNPRLLFAGTEFALHASLDGGKSWFELSEDLPTVAVDDLVIHPREQDLVIATHGRSLWVMDDITPLEQWRDSVTTQPVWLFEPRAATSFYTRPIGAIWGQDEFQAVNPPFGAAIDYFVREWTGDGVTIAISDSAGKSMGSVSGPGTPGVHRVTWDLQPDRKDRMPRTEWAGDPAYVRPGRYRLKLTYGKEKAIERWLTVKAAPESQDPDLSP